MAADNVRVSILSHKKTFSKFNLGNFFFLEIFGSDWETKVDLTGEAFILLFSDGAENDGFYARWLLEKELVFYSWQKKKLRRV